MRGIIFRADILTCHLPCPVCRRQATGLPGSRCVSRSHQRATSTKTDIPADVDPIQKPKWEAPLSERSNLFAPNRIISRQSWNPTSVLEGTSEASSGENNEGAENAAAREHAFYKIIREGQPDQVMDAMRDPQYRELVGSLPSSIFVEALHILSPAYFIEPYRPIYRPLHLTTVIAKQFKPLERIFDEFVKNIATIIRTRHEGGQALGLAEYKHLLYCARSMGDVQMADGTWEYMKGEGVEPDIQCYNYYMEAKIWDHTFTDREKYNLRVTPFYYRKRRFYHPPPGWRGYGTGPRSVRKQVLDIFKEMTERDIPGDEATFVNVMLASCRVGHMKGIKGVLKEVWNIDVDLLQEENDDKKIPQVTILEPWSPLYPSECLLFGVAHAFGTNNDISSGLRVIDYISRTYNIPVSENVWLELFERSFVLSRPRFAKDAVRNSRGRVSYDFLTALFETMISAPYHVRPTMTVYHMLAKTAWTRNRLHEFQHYMNAGYDLLRETRQKSKLARSVVVEYLTAASQGHADNRDSVLQSSALADAINSYGILRLITARLTVIMERLTRLLLIHHRWTGRDNLVWEWQLLPRMIEEWADFLPASFYCYSGTGVVKFEGKSHWWSPKIKLHNKVPIRRVCRAENPEIWKEAEEVDDDFFWQRFQAVEGRNLSFDRVPLNRLLWKSGKRRFTDELIRELEAELVDELDNPDLLTWLDQAHNTSNDQENIPKNEFQPEPNTKTGIRFPFPSIPSLSLPGVLRTPWSMRPLTSQ